MASALNSTRQFLVQVARLPMGPKLLVLGTLAAAIAILVVVFTYDNMEPPEPLYSAVGSAVVQADEAALLSAADGSGKELMKLPKGAKVNLLDTLSSLDVPAVRVQYVTPQKNSKPGYVRTADLGSWESNDPVSEWAFLAPSRARSKESPEEMRKFITQLRSFSVRFPGTAVSEKALVERAGLHLELAKSKKQAGRAKEEWEPDAQQAREALDGISASSANQADAAALKTELEGLLAAAPQQAQAPKEDANSAQLRGLLRSAKQAWDSGDLNACETYARRALALSPNNSSARGFLFQVSKAREALKD